MDLQTKLALKRPGVIRRYRYYEMHHFARDFGISTPPNLMLFNACLGWCAKAVDSLADRIQFDGFADDTFMFTELFRANNPDILFDAAIRGAVISSCSFVYIYPGDDGLPRFEVIPGADATGNLDLTTMLLTEGFAVLERDEFGQPSVTARFFDDATVVRYADGTEEIYEHNVGHPLLVPIINKPDGVRPFGRSRISRACMSIVDSAMRSVKRAEISAEFYSYPQKYLIGTEQGLKIEKWAASMSAMLNISKDEDGDKPTVGQFSQQSMSPYNDQLKMFASLFAGETGLTTHDLGFVGDVPQSEQAIRASHENLRLMAVKAQRDFAVGIKNVGYLGACLRDGFAYKRPEFTETTVLWRPLFAPDATQLTSLGDAILKMEQALPGYVTEEKIRELTGL